MSRIQRMRPHSRLGAEGSGASRDRGEATLALLQLEATEAGVWPARARRGPSWGHLLNWGRGTESDPDPAAPREPVDEDVAALSAQRVAERGGGDDHDDAAARELDVCRVLLIEDNAADARLIELALRGRPRPFAVMHERNLAAALEHLERERFDAILLDLNLSDSDGIETFIRIHAAAGGAPTIVLTNVDDEELGGRLVHAGAQDYLVKGEISSALLVRSIRHGLERGAVKAELAREREAAVAASRAKSEFLAAMSHEIRTPLNAILGTADLLLESGLNAEQEGYVRTFMRGGEALLHAINGILDLSKVEAGQLALEEIDFELGPLVEGTADLLAPQAHKKGLSLAFEIAPDVPRRLVGDPNRLRQVLVNLMGNAVKFTDAGHVALEVRTAGPEQPGVLQFAVTDTGVGIPTDRLHAIFDPFTQADTSITRRFGGTGLGLTLSTRLVGLMGGRLWVDSEEGRGSRFYFTAGFGAHAAPGAADLLHAARLSGMRVLIAEDGEVERAVLRRMLERCGAEVVEHADGEAALAAITEATSLGAPFALTFLASRMPGLGGLQVAERLTDRPETLARCVLMFTTDRRRDDLDRCHALSVGTWIEKPVKASGVDAALSRVLDPAGCEARARAEARSDAATDVQPLRVLVVDDSEDNRDLVRAYLKDMPYRLRLAEHGLAAVEAMQAETFDVVLMDMQMPRMDGFQATRVIREGEANGGRAHVPIVALTAHAFLEDRKRCFDAGCDAHLAKPVRKQELIGMIQRLAGGGPITVIPEPDLADLVDGYLENRRGDVPTLSEALERGDFETVQRLAHDMKGTGAGYGFDPITEIGRALEEAARREDADAAAFEIERLADYLRRVHVSPADAARGADTAPRGDDVAAKRRE